MLAEAGVEVPAIARAAAVQIDRGVACLGEGVATEVRLGEEEHAGHAAGRGEGVPRGGGDGVKAELEDGAIEEGLEHGA